jgi:FkbM family methyltransferase
VFERLSGHVQSNGLRQVALTNCALGDADAELTLSVITAHSGMATLAAPTADERRTVTAEYKVPVRRADDVLAELVGAPTPAVVKVDVEGYECRVLRGALELLRTVRPAVILELVPEYLVRAGDSAEALYRIMHDLGYAAYGATAIRRWLRWRLALTPLADASSRGPQNILWLHRDDATHRERVADALVASDGGRS